jgi:tRNA(fMet)-specific endonuclease VapC
MIYLLDTSVVIDILRRKSALGDRFQPDDVALYSIVLGELYLAARRSSNPFQQFRLIEQFVAGYPILPCDSITAIEYGNLKYQLESKGFRIPENDMWIGAIARQRNLAVVTRDVHFQGIEDLTVVQW